MTATWLQEAADRFWLDADGANEFPRNIEEGGARVYFKLSKESEESLEPELR